MSTILQIGEEVTIFDKLCDEAEWLLDGDTAKETNHMRILTLSYLLHQSSLSLREIPSFRFLWQTLIHVARIRYGKS